MDILVVEDDEDVREVLVEMLADEGFSVVSKSTAESAIKAVERASTIPGVAILDLHLGAGMGGLELAGILSDRWPNISIIYATGFLSDLEARVIRPKERYLPKPYTRHALIKMVRDRAPGTVASWLRRCAEVLGPSGD